jgi:selenocysteine-specific elongation factor
MIVGTAGHIDHGKTTLVKALTGVDADRLPEEQARGITLDLGYAYTPLPDGSVLGFVDVPGHEKLIHNMLAGATGIDFVLLVVAADDGPMPQTREHLELIGLLGLSRGAVALTKCDAVEPGRIEAVRSEIESLLSGSALEGAPVFPLSAANGMGGEGVAALRAHLEAAATECRERATDGRFRLAIDRCFTLPGIGTVVTGTAHSGKVGAGDTAVIAPPGLKVRVKSLHVQDRPAKEGCAGERCALALAGDFEKQDIARGMWLVDPALATPLTRFHCELRVPQGQLEQMELRHMQAVHVHLGAADITGRVALLDCEKVGAGGTALAEILLDRETLAVRGDRFVLRDASAQRSVAGGRVLDIFPPARHKRAPERLTLLRAMRDDDPAHTLALMCAQSPGGADLARFAANWNLSEAAAAMLWQSARLRVVACESVPVGFSSAGWQSLGERLIGALAHEHERAPDMVGVERERLRRMTLAQLPRAAFAALVDELLAAGRIGQTRAWLHLPEHAASVAPADRELFATLKLLLDAAPYNPPRVRDVARAANMPEDTVRMMFKRLARAGELYPVAHDHYFTSAAVAELARIVAELSAGHGAVRAAPFRDAIYGDGAGGRKVAIQILEFFDRVGYTRRVRDDHVLRREAAAHGWTMT